MSKRILSVLSDCGKTSSFIDDITVVKKYSAGLSHDFPVCSDDETLSRAKKEVLFSLLFLVAVCGVLFSNSKLTSR